MSLFIKSSTSRRARKHNQNAISQMEAIIKKLKTGELSVETVGFWNGATPNLHTFSLVVKDADIPVLSEELRKNQ